MNAEQVQELHKMMRTAWNNILSMELHDYSPKIPDLGDCLEYVEKHIND